jgi:hypothetical protein
VGEVIWYPYILVSASWRTILITFIKIHQRHEFTPEILPGTGSRGKGGMNIFIARKRTCTVHHGKKPP